MPPGAPAGRVAPQAKDSLRRRCPAHKLHNLQSKVPEQRWREVLPAARAVYQATSQALVKLAAEGFRKAWSKELPAAVACFDDDFDACIAHLKVPVAHRWGDTNHESAGASVRRRTPAASRRFPMRLANAR